MSIISSPGLGSGLDIKSIVEALVNADVAPAAARLNRQELRLNTQLSALGVVKSSLDKLQNTLNKLGSLSDFYAKSATVSDNSILSANLDSNASNGSYQIEVGKLAQKQNLASAAVASANTVIGSGVITINFGTYNDGQTTFTDNPDKDPLVINLSPTQNTLAAIRDAINASNKGVSASIVQDSQGARLTLSSPATGKDFAMKIMVTDDDATHTNTSGLSALAFDPTTGVNSMTQTVAAQNSEVLINGLALSQASNQLKDAIAGVTLDLKKAQPGSPIFLTIAQNQSQITTQLNDFIKQFNDTITTINNITGYNPETKKGGVMQSDAGIRSLKFSLNQIASQVIQPDSPLRSLADLGITSDSKGFLSLKQSVLDNALNNHFDDIGHLFAQTATATDSGVRINKVAGSIKAGTYNINLDDFTPGVSLSGSIGDLAASSDNGLSLTGSAALKGLVLDIISGTTGARGSITVQDGLAAKMAHVLDDYLGDTGTIKSRSSMLNNSLEDVGKQRSDLQLKATSIEKRYLHQFTALDTLLAQMQGTSQFLSQHLNNLSNFSSR